jgi:hypothetical protein
MIGLLVLAALTVCVGVIPVMVGARIVGAHRNGFWPSLFAVILLVMVGAGVGMFVDNKLASSLITALIGAFFLAGILQTTFLRGLAVSLIAAVVQVVILVLLAGALLGGAVLTH